jgi:hypothetical protein
MVIKNKTFSNEEINGIPEAEHHLYFFLGIQAKDLIGPISFTENYLKMYVERIKKID